MNRLINPDLREEGKGEVMELNQLISDENKLYSLETYLKAIRVVAAAERCLENVSGVDDSVSVVSVPQDLGFHYL